MLSVNDIVSWANEKICLILPDGKTYGIAKAATRDSNIMPYVDEKYIGVDDTFPAQVYHKLLNIASTNVPASGFGDNDQNLQNTYGMAMIIYFSEDKCGAADQLYTFIQSSITGRLKSEGYRSIRVSVTSAVLNDAQVWAQEYGQSPFKLSGLQRLIQVNYNIVMVYDKKCISLPNCKN